MVAVFKVKLYGYASVNLFGGDFGEEEGVFRQVDETDIMAELKNGKSKLIKHRSRIFQPQWRHSVR